MYRKLKSMNWLRSALASPAWSGFWKQPIRRSIARALLRLGNNSAHWAESLALWIDPTIAEVAQIQAASQVQQ